MKRSKFTLSAMGLVLLALPVMQGCGGPETKSESGSAANGSINLTMGAWGNPAELKVYQKGIDAYMEKNPNVQIKLIPTPSDGYEQKLLTQLSGNNAPDVFYVGDGTMSRLIKNQSIAELTEFLNSPDSAAKLDEYSPGLWGVAKQDDKYYGVMVDCNPLVLYYNKKLFQDAGVKLPQEYFDAGEWNWETFDQVTAKLKEAGKYGFVQEKSWSGMSSWIWANGGKIYDEQGNYVLDKDPKSLEAVKFVARLVQNKQSVYAGSLPQGQGVDAMFLSNQAAMVAAGRWLTPLFSTNKSLDFDYIPYPTNTGNKTEPAAVATAYMAVNKNSAHAQEAMKFLSFYVSKEGQKIRLSETGNAVPSVTGIDEIVTANGIPPHAQYLLDARKIGVAAGSPQQLDARVAGLSKDAEDIYDLMLLGKDTPETTVQKLAAKVKQKIAEDKQ
ncbi:ABC transporter substrate-binding protein [Paenibacillus xerothermodurans]|uniref:Sugar ABC transporter substrate-binding protein n=1 Tax=Paenibacillus xerothermodurans TaxID=1977292 RepID=A0A2W1P043_PAEXE|nr:sugar ABC transporter substrate-binding protein [Paenibacillus xerothermodurans]PZE21102.1 sugar ABC transporter substrate-binding protein [Paenibacillus xerothermodurans]